MKKDREPETHPAWGLVGFSRVQGGSPVFFGSDVPSDHYITLSISPAQRRHDLGQDWIGPANAAPIVEVAMTSHQFAELLTSMNVGSGVPCTIKYLNGQTVERLERVETEGDRIKKYFKERSTEKSGEIADRIQAVQDLLQKDKLSKADRTVIGNLLSSVQQEYRANQPFYLEQFEESTEKMIVQAKAEVDAFITHVVVSTGLEHLRKLKHDTTLDLKEGPSADVQRLGFRDPP